MSYIDQLPWVNNISKGNCIFMMMVIFLHGYFFNFSVIKSNVC